MADPHVVPALKNKRADLTDRIIVPRKEITALVAAVRYCDGALALFDSDLDPEKVKPKLPQHRLRTFGHGEMARLVPETLCATDAPLETSEITGRLAQVKVMPTEGPVFKEMQLSLLRAEPSAQDQRPHGGQQRSPPPSGLVGGRLGCGEQPVPLPIAAEIDGRAGIGGDREDAVELGTVGLAAAILAPRDLAGRAYEVEAGDMVALADLGVAEPGLFGTP